MQQLRKFRCSRNVDASGRRLESTNSSTCRVLSSWLALPYLTFGASSFPGRPVLRPYYVSPVGCNGNNFFQFWSSSSLIIIIICIIVISQIWSMFRHYTAPVSMQTSCSDVSSCFFWSANFSAAFGCIILIPCRCFERCAYLYYFKRFVIIAEKIAGNVKHMAPPGALR